MTASVAPAEGRHRKSPGNSVRAVDVDSLWGMAVLVTLTAFLSTVVITNAPFFYVRFLKEYGATHEAASWPLTIVALVSHLVGVPVYLLQRRTSVYRINLVGSVLMWMGVISSAFAAEIGWLTFSLGVIYGAGLGVVMICLSIYTMDYFDKFRGTVSGLKYVGWSASGLVFPVILANVVDAYSFPGMLILLGGLMANITPVMVLLKHPPTTMKWKSCLRLTKHFSPKTSDYNSIVNGKHSGKYCSMLPAEAAVGRPPQVSPVSVVAHLTSSVESSNGQFTSNRKYPEQNKTGNNVSDSEPVPRVTSKYSFTKAVLSILGEEEGEAMDEGRLNSAVGGSGEHRPGVVLNEKTKINENGHNGPTSRSWTRRIWGNASLEGSVLDTAQKDDFAGDVLLEISAVLRTPALYALAGIYVLFDYSYIAIMSSIVAYAVDKGSELPLAESLIMYAAVSGMAGRLVVPFASDTLVLRRDAFVACNLIVVAICVALLPEVSSHAHVALLVVGVSIASGSVLAMKPVLVTEYVGVQMMTATWGVMGVLMVPLMLSNPVIVGYFRDGMGSFDNFYRLHSALNVLIAFILFALTYHRNNRDPKLNQ